jgi:hypothetical protein
VFDRFIPFSTMGGSVLLQSNNRVVVTEPRYYGYAYWDSKIPEYREALRAPNDEVERDRVAKNLAIKWLHENPEQWLFLLQAKFRRGWTPLMQPDTPAALRYVMLLSWGPVLVVFAAAFFPTLWSFFRRRHPGWLLHLAVVQFVVTTLIFFGYARYRSPIEPICILIATAGAAYLVRMAADFRQPAAVEQNVESQPA